MPTITPTASSATHTAIARASQSTGVDFDYLVAQARLESGLDPAAKAATSSATGLYQFIDSTWLRTVDRHGAKHGLGWAEAAIDRGGRVRDPAVRSQIMDLRYDAATASLMAGELARENAAGLGSHLGREPEPSELYLAHFLGLGGARRFLDALGSDPSRSAAAILPQAAGANRSIFYAGGRPRSLGEVMDLMRAKVAGAYAQGGAAADTGPTLAMARDPVWPPRRNSAATLNAAGPAPRPSMADVIQSTFGRAGAAGDSANRTIAAAYGRFRAFGL